jgi:ABC-type multidrug transport system fused ATPase/permease subunit
MPARQVVGIVGPSGSSKSTLAKLIQRLFVPETGRVLVDGVDLAMVDPGWLRRQATSQLDYESERIIQQNMERIAHGRTVIIIAHRLSTVRRCHRILTLERGRLVEDGSHDELIRTGGRYASLHRLQSGIHELVG